MLPGNAGFDLRIQRTYNSKIYRRDTGFTTLDEDSWAGVGWTLHFGRIWNAQTNEPSPVVEMPDGSRHQMFHDIPGGPLGNTFISRDYWIYNRNTQILTLPNGLVYTFGRTASINGVTVAYVTDIRDPFGNFVQISYDSLEKDVITQVVQNLGTQTRTVTFGKELTYRSLRTMTYATGTRTYVWTYTQQNTDAGGFSRLVSVQPPITTGSGWQFVYEDVATPKWELKKITTPNGGEINYTYDEFESRLGSTLQIRFRGVKTRTTGGRDVPAGFWQYGYAETAAKNRTTISGPCDTTQLNFLGVGNTQAVAAWMTGLLATRTISDATSNQSEDFGWRTPGSGDRISDDDENIVAGGNSATEIYVPLLQSRSVTRNGRSYVTTNTYSTSNFNDFGRPNLIVEDGPDIAGNPDRTTSRTFDYAFGTLYIKDRVSSETVSVGSESFVRTYSYRDADGFKDSETIHGITQSFAPGTRGNVASVTDESNHTTGFTYSWGVLDNTQTPLFLIDRTINPEGTVASETRRGFTTSFTYDDRFRPTLIDRPFGNDPTLTYDNSGVAEFTQINQGASSTTTYLDGFERPSATENSVGVKTDIRYDACGRRTYESYPFAGSFSDPNVNKGTTSTFDALNRLRRRQHPDNAAATFDYSDGGAGIKLRITNERSKVTEQIWKSFGDPDEARLATLFDANAKTWSYTYNAMGSITRVTPPTGPIRAWTYYGPNESQNGHGLLKTETFPENENRAVTYTYYADGLLWTRDDPRFGTTTFIHDANHRPFTIDRPGTTYDTEIRHDASDNRTTLNNGYVTSAFVYDGSNRLTSRQDTVNGITHTTGYTPDGNDNVQKIDYPSGLSVTYAYDSENRVTSARKTTGACPDATGGSCFAYAFQYHPSGSPTSYKTGNERLHSFTYDANRYWLRSINSGVYLQLDYPNYDLAGNVLDINDARPGFNQHFVYDDLDRLTTANGVWSTGSFAYDERGNRRSKTIAGQTTNFTYSTSFDRLDAASAPEADTFGYDFNGNLVTQNGRTYTYSPENMVETATVGGVPTTYRYDGDNLRKQRSTVGAGNRYFVHGPSGQLLVEYEDDCNSVRRPVREYVYAGSRLVAAVRHGQQRFVSVTAPPSVSESANDVTFTVTVTTSDNQPITCPVRVAYGTADGTAQAGLDYNASTGVVTFPVGTISGTPAPRPVTIRPDTLDEEDETFTFTLSAPTGADLVSPSVLTMTIEDDDPPPTVSVSDCGVTETTGFNIPCAFGVSLSTASGKFITVIASTQNGTAIAGVDYVARTNVLLPFPAGTTSVAFPVDVIGDAIDEPTEAFSVVLSSPVNATPGDMVGDATIVDDDPPAQMSIGDTTVNDRNAGNIAYLPVTLNIQSGFTITVNFATTSSTAIAGSDFIATSGVLTFQPGEVRQLIPVAIIQDMLEEGVESFVVDLSNSINTDVIDARGQAFIVERNALPPACASRLDPMDDGTGIPVDLLVSEIAPGAHIELYNPGANPIALASVLHHLNSEPQAVALSALGPAVIVPARGYSRLDWPADFTDSTTGGEVILFKNPDFNTSQNIVDFVCWGTNPHGSRKAQAVEVGKWSGDCAAALSGGALHRLRGTNGTTLQSYDVSSPSSPMNCVGIFTVTKGRDSNDGACDGDCSLREAIIAANAAPGEDTIRLPKGTYPLVEPPAGEDAAIGGDLDITDTLWLAGAGARSTIIQNDASPDRIIDVRPGATATITGITINAGNAGLDDGGGVRTAGSLTLRDVSLTQSAAVRGGAVAVVNAGSVLTLNRVTAEKNVVTGEGGAVELSCSPCSATLTDTTLSGNSSTGAGGGLHVGAGASVQLTGVTVTQNISGTTGGGVVSSGGTVTFRNSIVAENSDFSGQAPDCLGGTLVSQQYNLIGDGTGCSFPPGTGDQIGVAPLLGPLANNRGPTSTHALLSGSPAIDTANPTTPGSTRLACEARDQRSYFRPFDGAPPTGAQCDKGAFELCSPVFDDTVGHFAEPFVKELNCRGIAGGCGASNFCPDAPVTRAEMAVFLVASVDEEPSGVAYDEYFTDIADDGFAKYINRISELRITAGCGTRLYCPGAPVTRRAMAVFLITALEEQPSTAAYNAYFADIPPNDPTAKFINRVYELNISAGCGTGPGGELLFCPDGNVSRGTMAVWLVAAFFGF